MVFSCLLPILRQSMGIAGFGFFGFDSVSLLMS